MNQSWKNSNQVFDTLSGALSSIGIPREEFSYGKANSYEATLLHDGASIVTDSEVFDLHYMSTLNWHGFDSADLCSLCRGITAVALASPAGYLHAPSLTTLFLPAHEKCCLCKHMQNLVRCIPPGKKHELLKPGNSIRMALVKHGEVKALAGSAITFRIGDLEIQGIQAKFYVRCYEGIWSLS